MSVSPQPQMSDSQDLVAARERFPGSIKHIYMDVAARGLLSLDAREAVDRHLDERMHGGNKDQMFELIERCRHKFALLIGAQDDEIALTKNVSEGLNIIAAALPWQAGDNVVLCSELEHPNNIYPWLHQARRHGAEVRDVPAIDGEIPINDMLARIDKHTRAVAVSSVTFAPGYRMPFDKLGAACRDSGTMLCVDAAQSAGVMRTDVNAEMIGALATSTQKGLLGLYGMGFLYCRKDWALQLSPVHLARFGVDLGSGHEAEMGSLHYELAAGARRFEIGNYNYAAAAAVEASLDLLDGIGVRQTEEHVRALSDRLARGLHELGLACSRPGTTLAHIVSAGRPGTGHNTTDDQDMQKLYDRLVSGGVRLSIRRGQLRFSLHLYNNVTDVDRVLDQVDSWCGGHAAVGKG